MSATIGLVNGSGNRLSANHTGDHDPCHEWHLAVASWPASTSGGSGTSGYGRGAPPPIILGLARRPHPGERRRVVWVWGGVQDHSGDHPNPVSTDGLGQTPCMPSATTLQRPSFQASTVHGVRMMDLRPFGVLMGRRSPGSSWGPESSGKHTSGWGNRSYSDLGIGGHHWGGVRLWRKWPVSGYDCRRADFDGAAFPLAGASSLPGACQLIIYGLVVLLAVLLSTSRYGSSQA